MSGARISLSGQRLSWRALRQRAGWASWPGPRVGASFNPVIDFFNAGGNGGLPRPELRFTSDIRKTGPGIDDPVPPGRRAFLTSNSVPRCLKAQYLLQVNHQLRPGPG